MATECITQAVQETEARRCRELGPLTATGATACSRSRMRVCPPPNVAPVIEQGKDGINLLGVYQVCAQKPVTLAPYPPGKPLPNEETEQATLARTKIQVSKQTSAEIRMRSTANQARKIHLSLGFWIGLGLVGLGGVAFYVRRRE